MKDGLEVKYVLPLSAGVDRSSVAARADLLWYKFLCRVQMHRSFCEWIIEVFCVFYGGDSMKRIG